MRFITEIREKISPFWEGDDIHLANVERLYSHSAKTERGYSQMEEKQKRKGEEANQSSLYKPARICVRSL